MDRFLERRSSAAGELRRSLIHHDANTHNVLVSSLDPAKAEIAGLIDFGDLVVTETVFEAAIAATYAALESEDPWEVALTVSRGLCSSAIHCSRPNWRCCFRRFALGSLSR